MPIKKKLIMVKQLPKIKVINGFRFTSTSLSKLVKYLSGKLHSNKCTYCKTMSFNNDQLIFRCFECKENYQKDFVKDLINRFANT